MKITFDMTLTEMMTGASILTDNISSLITDIANALTDVINAAKSETKSSKKGVDNDDKFSCTDGQAHL